MEEIVLITPPFTQLNSPYPATTFLSGTLDKLGYKSCQIDLSIDTAIAFFSKKGLKTLFEKINKLDKKKLTPIVKKALLLRKSYINCIDTVISFLQGKDPNFAYRIVNRDYLPEGKRFEILENFNLTGSSLEISDTAKFMASLFIDDVVDFTRESIAPEFSLSSYNEKLGLAASFFAPIEESLSKNDFILNFTFELMKNYDFSKTKLVCITVPFPGNLYSALKIAHWLKKRYSNLKIALGGGYINTELQKLREPNIFKFVDFITLDDGETPLIGILDYLKSNDKTVLVRTFVRENNKVIFYNNKETKDLFGKELGFPTARNLDLTKYFSLYESINPMHRLWSERGWNKLRLSHGCYWQKCAFCDVTLNYISEFRNMPLDFLLDQIESLIKETGIRAFHFVDEAMHPKLLENFSIALIKRNIQIIWWGNIRFEREFSLDLSLLLKEAGCIALVGGLETVTEKMLKKMNKGVTLQNAVQSCKNFAAVGIMVHSYLIYGFPEQSMQDIMDSLEIIRQMFENEILNSVFWHRFSLTVHSPIAKNPLSFGLKITDSLDKPFANNEISYKEIEPQNVDRMAYGLRKAVYNYTYGKMIDEDIRSFFDFEVLSPIIKDRYVANIISEGLNEPLNLDKKIIWLGSSPVITKKEKDFEIISFPGINKIVEYELPTSLAHWFLNFCSDVMISNGNFKSLCLQDIADIFPNDIEIEFSDFTKNELWLELKFAGLLTV